MAAAQKLGVDPAIAPGKVEILTCGKVVRFTERDMIAAIELHRLHRISFRDAMIVRAACAANAPVLFGGDLADGSTVARRLRSRYVAPPG